jgi:hypothetical protein
VAVEGPQKHDEDHAEFVSLEETVEALYLEAAVEVLQEHD